MHHWRTAVHPRACGEQRPATRDHVGGFGSSPRLRGTGLYESPQQPCCRFIPAPAGNSHPGRYPNQPTPVHPRACGEQMPSVPPGLTQFGSSPRLRGTAHTRNVPNCEARFIPAPAGNRGSPPSRLRFPPVHPRACGEQGIAAFKTTLPTGSSPRLRGTVRHHGLKTLQRRFIPAPAGNRFWCYSYRSS